MSQPAADHSGCYYDCLHALYQNSFLSCLQGEENSCVSWKRSTATRPRRACVSGVRTHLPIHQLLGGQQPLQRGYSAAPSMKPREGQQRREAGRQHRSDEQGQRYKGGRKGLDDPNPKNHHPDQLACGVSSTGSKGRKPWKPLPWRPSLAPARLSSFPLAPSPVLHRGREAREPGAMTPEQAVTMVTNATPFQPLRNFSISSLS